MACVTCLWFAVLILDPPAAAGPDPARKSAPSSTRQGCVSETCHATTVGRPFMHAPAAQHKCEACHVGTDAEQHEFRLASEKAVLCLTCHTIKTFDFMHTPVRDGQCLGCHDPHGSSFRSLLVADPVEGLCTSCHDLSAYTQRKSVHPPVASQACVLCHEPHGSWRSHLLTQEPRALCLSCHAAVAQDLAQSRHVHPPLAEGNCTACHDPHASDHPHHLTDAPARLCLTCHAPIGEAIRGAAFVHEAVRSQEACLNCHAGHAADLPGLLPRMPMDICLDCHDTALPTPQGPPLQNMASLLAENPYHHGPIRSGDCTVCHDPHASPHFRLLDKEYPPGFYAAFALDRYALCFSCHMREMVLQKYGTGLTGFARSTTDGVENLHFVHVNKDKKGRTCRACHEVHASRRPFHIRDSVPFGDGGWALDINFVATAEGGSCSPACHATQSYARPGGARGSTLTGAQP